MSELTTHTENDTTKTGFPPVPPEAHQGADALKTERMAMVPASYVVVMEDKSLGVIVFKQMGAGGKVYLQGFSGRRMKPDFHYSFRSEEAAVKFQGDWYARIAERAQRKANARAEKRAAMAKPQSVFAVGDVLVSSWGYEQTNYDFYQVTRLVGARSVEIRELKQMRDESGFLRGECVPHKNNFAGEPMVKRVNEHGSVKVRDWGVWASKFEPRAAGGVEVFAPCNYTAYH